MPTIREATPDDVDELAAMHGLLQEHMERANSRIWRLPPEAVAGRADVLRGFIEDESSVVYVAEEDGELVGFVTGTVSERDAAPSVVGSIGLVFVREGGRGEGIGTALMDTLLGFFESKGVGELTTRYVVGNREAERFWPALGFEALIITANAPLDVVRRQLDDRQ